MNKKHGVLCIFTKAPVPGKVKTRLIPALGEEKATELYINLLRRTLDTACASDRVDVRLYCTPTTTHPMLQECAQRVDVELCLQQGDELGARMCNALLDGLKEHDYALVLGCDCPWLKTEDLELAYDSLASQTEVVLGPAKDGGYYLLGLCTAQNYLFDNMPWGESTVLEETRRRLSLATIDWFELNEYADIDVPEDLPAYEKLLTA